LEAALLDNQIETYVFKPLRYIPDMCIMDFPEGYDVDGLVEKGFEVELDSTLSVDSIDATVSTGKDYPVRPPLWHLDAVHSRGVDSRSSSVSRTRKGAGVDIYVVDMISNLAHPEFNNTPGRYVDVNDGITSSHVDWLAPSFGIINDTGLQSHGCATAMVAAGDTVGVAPEATVVLVPVGTPAVDGIYNSDVVDGLNAVLARVDRQSPYRHAVINYSIGAAQTAIYTLSNKYMTFALKTTYKVVQDTYNIPIVKSAGNASFGTAGNIFAAFSPPYRRTITNFAEGNGDFSGLTSPIFSVGSCEIEDNVSQWSIYGDVMLSAPGIGIHIPNTELTADSEAKVWSTIQGTSFSAPIVTGLIALYLQGIPVTDSIDLTVLGTWLVANSTKGVMPGIGTYESTYDPFLHFAGATLKFDDMDPTIWSIIGVVKYRNGVFDSTITRVLPAYASEGTTTAGMTITVKRYTDTSIPGDYDQYYGYVAAADYWYLLYVDYSVDAGVTAVDEAAEYAAHPTPNRMAFNPYSTYVDHYADPQTFIFDADTDKLRIRCSKISWSGFAMNQQTASVLSGTLPPGVSLACDHKSCFLTCDSLASAETTTPQTIVVRVVENQNAENNTFDIPCTITVSHARGYGIEIFDEAGAPANIIDGYGLQLLHRVTLIGTGSHSFSFPLGDRNIVNGALSVVTEPLDNSVITDNRERLVFQRYVVPSVWIENGLVQVRVFIHVSWDTREACVIGTGDTLASLEANSEMSAEIWSTEASEFPYGGLQKV
jgi:subtilisin family serine protease